MERRGEERRGEERRGEEEERRGEERRGRGEERRGEREIEGGERKGRKLKTSELQCDRSARYIILTLVLMLCAVVIPVIQL